MNTRLMKRLIYTINNLTGIAKKCDWFINGYQILKLNDNEPRIIFLTAHRGNTGIKNLMNNLISQIKSPFILIIASEDYTFPTGKGDLRYSNYYKNCEKLIQKLIQNSLLIHIFVENLDTPHPKMSPIPLGLLENNVSIDTPDFYCIDFTKKTNLCFVCNRIRYDGSNQWIDRINANQLSKTKWKDFVKCIDVEIPHNEFINELKISKFCLVIHGGGYDPCPKFFECILYGVIPIIQHSPLDDVFNKYPVVFIDDLNEEALSENFLITKYEELKDFYEGEKRKEVLSLLTLDYWWNIIIGKFKK